MTGINYVSPYRHQNADSHFDKYIFIPTIHVKQQWQDKGPAGGSNTKCMAAHYCVRKHGGKNEDFQSLSVHIDSLMDNYRQNFLDCCTFDILAR